MEKGFLKPLILTVCVLMLFCAGTALARESVTIRVAGWMGNYEDWISEAQALVAPYGIIIEYEQTADSTYRDRVITQTLGGVGPDVVQELPYRYAFHEAKILTDLTPYLEKDPEFRDQFVPAMWNLYTYFDGTWLVPAAISPYLFFYNKEHFRQQGIAPPTADWHWSTDVYEAATKLHVLNPDGSVRRYGLLLELRMLTPVFSNGGEVVSPDNTRSLLDQPEVVELMEMFQEWYTQGLFPRVGNQRPAFAAGNGAMHGVMGTFAMPTYADHADLDWGIAYVPQGKAGRWIEENTWGFGIHRDTQHPEEAWLVVKALASVSGKTLMEAGGQISPIQGRFSDPDVLGILQDKYGLSNEEIVIIGDSLNYVRPSYRHLRGADIHDIKRAAFTDILRNGRAPGVALSQAAARITALLQQ